MANFTKEQYMTLFLNMVKASREDYLRHGVRAAYLAQSFCEHSGRVGKIAQDLTLAAVFHDVGSAYCGGYSFVRQGANVFAHAAYGAVLIKRYCEKLSPIARIILHHHDVVGESDNGKTGRCGRALHLIDDIEFWQSFGLSDAEIKKRIGAGSGTEYDPQDAKAANAMIDAHVLEFLKNGAADVFVDDFFTKAAFPKSFYRAAFNLVYALSCGVRRVRPFLLCEFISFELARRLPFRKPSMLDVRSAALLSDVGMCAVPRELLKNDSPQSEAQKSEIDFAESILSDLPDKFSIPAIRKYENLDGSGVLGLNKDELSLADRTLAVASRLAALYANDATDDEVIGYFKKQSDEGKADGNIVFVFVRDMIDITYKLKSLSAKLKAKENSIIKEAEFIVSTHAPRKIKK